MRKICYFIPMLAFLLFSCSEKQENGKEMVRPVKTDVAVARNEIRKDFAGIVGALDHVKLAFRVNGQIINIPVGQGQRVKKGQLIAQIDPREISPQYAADRSSFETATAQLERNKRLLSKQAISQQDYEISESNYQQAKSAYELSTNNMRDTRLYAPFDGSVEDRYVEKYQRITVGEPIIRLVNTATFNVKFIVPDAYFYLLKTKKQSFSVTFDIYPDVTFKARIGDYLDISTSGTGVPVTIYIDDPKFDPSVYLVKPGFTCNVHFDSDISEFQPSVGYVMIPMTAVFEIPGEKGRFTWVVKDGRVTRRKIDIYAPTGEAHVLVSSGIQPGEKVVIAGVYQLQEGQRVKSLN